MIIVAAHIFVKPGTRESFLEAAKPCIAITNTEKGCISYTLLCDPNDEGKLMFFEEWESMADLQAHLGAPHLADFQTATKDFRAGDARVDIYEGSKHD